MRSIPVGLWVMVGTTACQPATTRPEFAPLPEAFSAELRLTVPEATRRLAEAFRADSIPTQKVRLRDGYIESPWFSARTGKRTTRRALGPAVVRVRAWADPARPGNSQLIVETLYRPLADPSLPERQLERQVATNHPVAKRVEATLKRLVDRYGAPPPPKVEPSEPPPEEESPE